MKLHWFSPLPPAKTAIARYSSGILSAFRERAEITLWTDQTEWDAGLAREVEVRRYQSEQIPWAELNRADMCIYHIGNDPHFHSSIWQVSRYHPGVVILHDLHLQHLFAGLDQRQWQDHEGYCAAMAYYYGTSGEDAAKEFWKGRLSTEYMAEYYPLTPLAVEKALGVLVHTRRAFDTLKKDRCRPVSYVPLPYPASPYPRNNRSYADKDRTEGPPYQLIVFGYINTNRRLDAIIRALAEFPHREQFRLDVYGQLWDTNHLRMQIQARGLADLVTLRGFVSAEELTMALKAAHLAINLRYPTMGEASFSQLEIWDHALPSLVTQVGWYAELPEDTVAFVRPEQEIADIHTHLQAFLDDPTSFAKKGENGRRLLAQCHAPERYVQAVVDFVIDAQRFRSPAVAYGLAERVGAELSLWASAAVSDAVLRKVAQEIHALVV